MAGQLNVYLGVVVAGALVVVIVLLVILAAAMLYQRRRRKMKERGPSILSSDFEAEKIGVVSWLQSQILQICSSFPLSYIPFMMYISILSVQHHYAVCHH